MKKSLPIVAILWLLIASFGSPLVADVRAAEGEEISLAAPDIDPWEWILPKRRNESCQPLSTCACGPDTSSKWCIQSGLSCKDSNGYDCQWPPLLEEGEE